MSGSPPAEPAQRGGHAFSLRDVRRASAGVTVLDGVTVDLPEGKVTAIVGPSGAGKSSLLRLLNRLDDAAAGEIRYRDRPIAEYPIRQLRGEVGFVFQTPVMFPGAIRDNLRLASELSGRSGLDVEMEMRAAMELAELDRALIDRDAGRLSVGQKQRANLARALMTRPRVLLMDEPTSALDGGTADRLVDTIRRLSSERSLTVVMVTHRLREAQRASDVTAVMDAGRVIRVGPTREILQAGPGIHAFLGSGR